MDLIFVAWLYIQYIWNWMHRHPKFVYIVLVVVIIVYLFSMIFTATQPMMKAMGSRVRTDFDVRVVESEFHTDDLKWGQYVYRFLTLEIDNRTDKYISDFTITCYASHNETFFFRDKFGIKAHVTHDVRSYKIDDRFIVVKKCYVSDYIEGKPRQISENSDWDEYGTNVRYPKVTLPEDYE